MQFQVTGSNPSIITISFSLLFFLPFTSSLNQGSYSDSYATWRTNDASIRSRTARLILTRRETTNRGS